MRIPRKRLHDPHRNVIGGTFDLFNGHCQWKSITYPFACQSNLIGVNRPYRHSHWWYRKQKLIYIEHSICGATEKPPLLILDSVEPCHYRWPLLRLPSWRCMASLESDVCTSGVGIGRLEMGVVNVVTHRYEHSGTPPALSGCEPDRAGLTQTFTTR